MKHKKSKEVKEIYTFTIPEVLKALELKIPKRKQIFVTTTWDIIEDEDGNLDDEQNVEIQITENETSN